MDKQKLYIFGAGAAGKAVANIIQQNFPEYNFCGFWDDNITFKEQYLFSKRVIIEYQQLIRDSNIYLISSIGTSPTRENVYRYLDELGFSRYISIVHPSVIFNDTIIIGKGCIIYQGVMMDPDVIIKDNVMINKGVSIGHDVIINSHCVLSPNCSIGGNVKIGKSVFIGMNACVKQGTSIGNNVIVGMGAVVLENIPDNAVVVGNPARIIKYNS